MSEMSFVKNFHLSHSGKHDPLAKMNWSLQFTSNDEVLFVMEVLLNEGIISVNKEDKTSHNI